MISDLERHCIVCGEEIKESMGFALARDVSALLNGERSDMREFCGKDVLKLTYHVSEGILVERPQEEIKKDLERYLTVA